MKYLIILLITIIVYQMIRLILLKTMILNLEQENDLLCVGRFNEEQKQEDVTQWVEKK